VTDRYGGAIYCSGSSPEFIDCVITNNAAPDGNGGALHSSNGAPNFTNCSITNNSCYSQGGAIDLYGSQATCTFTNCTIDDNSSDVNGGGFYCSNNASPVVVSCSISDNTAGSNGGGFYFQNAFASIEECSINNNTADSYGGGAACVGGSNSFTKCTIAGNGSDFRGGGVNCQNSSSTFNSTIIAFSDGDGVYFYNSSESVFDYCDIYGNSGGDLTFQDDDPSHGPDNIGELTETNFNGDPCDIYSNIFLDPMLVDVEAGDVHLLPGSSCIDAGDPALENDPDGTIADIGVFYFHADLPPSAFSLRYLQQYYHGPDVRG